jgi:hypothetical protein
MISSPGRSEFGRARTRCLATAVWRPTFSSDALRWLQQTAYVVFVQATSDRDWGLDLGSRLDGLLDSRLVFRQRQGKVSRLYLDEALQHLSMRARNSPRFGLR